MEFSVLLADLRDVAEKYKGKTTEPQVSTNAYVDMFTKILKRAEKSTENYDDKITVLWVALNQLASIYKDLSACPARDQLCKFIFGLCAKTVLNIQWSQLEEDSKVRINFSTTVENVHEILSQLGFLRFQLILNLMESHWTHPILSKIMSGDDEDTDDCLEYIQKEDPEILKLRIEIMMNENCEEFALNLCNWSLNHPALQNDLKIKEQQIYILYKQQEYEKMQEVCETIVCHDGIKVMSHLAQNQANQNLCIRLAQVFLIQDWINPERTCCTQELLQVWIHHQYLADKDEERFLDSIWTVAKVCRDTEQIGVLIDGVKKECGDMFIQLYTELCKYAINIDKGNLEREEVQNDEEEMSRRKLAMSKTCVRMAFMLKEYDFRMSRICGLTAFALEPTMDNLNLVNKLYWTHKNVSAASKNSKIDIASLYEIERLLGLMRHESLKPEYSWKQLIPLCKKFKADCENEKLGKSSVSVPEQNFPAASPPMPHIIRTIDNSNMGNVQSKVRNRQPQLNTKDIEKAHLVKLLGQKNIPPDQIERILSKHFPRNTNKELHDGPALNMKQLDKTIDDLKKSIYLETEYRESMKQSLSSLQRSKKGDSSVHSSSAQNQHVSTVDQFSSQYKHSSIQRQHSAPDSSNTQGNNVMHRQTSVGSRQPPTAHSHHRQQQFSPVRFGGSPPPAHSSVNRMSSPVGVAVDGSTRLGSPSELGNNHKNPYLHHSSHSKSVSEQLSKRIKEEMSRKQHQKTTGNIPFNILRPPGNDKQECAKIAQQIAELHERKRAERERLEKIRLQGHLDGVKAVLNSRNIASRSQISDLLTLTFQGNKPLEKQTSLPNSDNLQGKSYGKKKPDNSSTVSSMNPMQKSVPAGLTNVSGTPGSATGRSMQGTPEGTVTKAPSKKAHASILRQGEKTWDAKRGMMKQKYYLSTECVKSADNKLQKTTSSDSNLSVKPVYSMIVPKSLTNPERTEELVNAVTNIIKNFPQGGDSVPRVALHDPQQSVKPQNVASVSHGQKGRTSTDQNVNMSTAQNVSNQGPVGSIMSGTSIPLVSNCNNSTVGMISQNGLCIPVTGHTATVVSGSDNNLLNLNTLASASVSVLGQAANQQPQLGEQFRVSLQQPQQLFSPVIDSQQLFTTIQTGQSMQQVCQQPDPIFATPLYSLAQPLVVEPNIAMTGIQTQIDLNQTIIPQVNTVQNQPITLDTGQFTGAVNQQQASFQINVSNTMTNCVGNNPQPVQATEQKQCLAAPELSPALVQQLLTSIKTKTAQVKNTEKIQAPPVDKKSDQSTAKSATGNGGKQTPEHTKDETDKVLQRGVLEAQQKILQLRKQFEKASGATSTGKKKHYAGGIIEALVADDAGQETVKSKSDLPTFMSPEQSLTRPNGANTAQEIVPDLPDLGAKEFHIDDLLALDNDNSTRQNQVVDSTSSVTADASSKGSNVSISSTIGPNNSGTSVNTDRRPDRAQSTYFNANRLAKERENREAKTHDVNKPSKSCAKETRGRGFGKCINCDLSFSTWKQLEDHKANTNCGKPFKCDFCQMVFKSLELLNTHEKNYCLKAPTTIVKCHICGVYFESHEQLKAHLVPRTCSPHVDGHNALQQNSNEIVCGICERKVESMTAMKEHVKKGCLKKTTVKREFNLKDYEYVMLFQCSHCNFTNSAERTVLKHVEKCKEKNSLASMMKLYKCRMCNEIFTVTDDICRHVSKQCPKLRVANNQKHVQDTYQKLKTANMLQNDASKSPKTVVGNSNMKNPNCDPRTSCDDEHLSEKVPYISEVSDDEKHSNLKDATEKSDLNVSKALLNPNSGLIDSVGNVEGETHEKKEIVKFGEDVKPVVTGNDSIDETTIKLQKERRISAEKKFLAEFNEIERRKQEIRMRKQREIAMRKESMEKEERERIERDNLEAEKRKFIENILGKVTLQEKIKTDASSQRKVFRVELRKQPDEVKYENKRIVEEVHTDDNEDGLNEQKRQDKSLNVRRTNHVSRKDWNVKDETKEYRKYLEDVSPSKRRRKSSEEVEDVVDKATKRPKGNSELSTGSRTSAQRTETKKKRLSPQDIRKLKGLRAKRLIKQKKYYMDEMDPVRPNKRNVDSVEKKVPCTKVTNKRTLELVEKKASTVKMTDEKRKRAPRTPSGDQGFENELKKNEQKYLNECRFCEIRNKPYFGKKLYVITHYVRGHKLGYRNVNYQHLCNFCKQRYPSSQTTKIKRHVYMSHPRSILQNVASGKYDYLVGHTYNSRVSPLNKSKNKFGMSGHTPRRNDKMKKHLRALALRQKCADKLKRIAMHADDSVDDSSEAEEVHLVSTSSTDGEMSNKEVAKTTVSKSGRKIAPRLDRQLVHHSKLRRRSSGTGNDTEETGPRRLLRSRSSSVSSNRSSIIVSAKKRKAAMTTIRQKSSSSGERILVTRSGRAVRRADIRFSQSTESSGMDDDTSELEDASIKKRKSARIRRLSDKGKSTVEPSESDDSVSDEATARVTRRSLRVQLNETIDNKLTSRTRRSSGRNTERPTENADDQAIARKGNSASSAMSHGEKRKFVREEMIVTRQNSKNEEESDSETEGSYTDTESTLKSVNAKARRGGERSAESDSESTSYDDRRKRYRFRRRVNKHVYQESESENDDTERRTTANDDSEFEFSDELEEFRSTDTRNSFEDESSISCRLGLQQKSMAKVFEKPKRVLIGLVSDDQSDTANELLDDFISESSSPKMTKGGVKSKPVILAQDYDHEFAGLELEPAREILHTGKDAECELIEKSVEERTTEHDVGKTMDEMLELIPVLSERISRKTGKTRLLKDSVTKSSFENSLTPTKLLSPLKNAYAEFIQVKDTPDHMKSAIVVVKDIALEGGTSKCKMQKDKLIEACLKESCVVKINRLSDNDIEKHYHVENKNKNNICGIDTISVDDSDERSTEHNVSNSESKIGRNAKQHSMKSTIKSNMSDNDVTEVLIQDADITYSIDQLIAEESITDCFNTDIGQIQINTDIYDSNVHSENDVERNSYKEKSTNAVDVKNISCPVADKCSADMQGGEDMTSIAGKANSEVSVINNSIVNEEPNEDIWIENAETYAESTDEIKNDFIDQLHGSENLNSEAQNLDDKEEVTSGTDNSENGNKPEEPKQLVNEQEIIIDPSLSENIVCTIGNGEDTEETVLQIQVDGDTDILQLVVESSSDGTSANIVVAEHDVCIETTTPENGLDCIDEKSIDMSHKDDSVAEIILDNDGNGEILESDTGNASLETDTAESVIDDHGEGLQVENLSVESAWSNEVENLLVSSAGSVSPSNTISVSSKLDAEHSNIDSTTDVTEIVQEEVNSPVKIIKCSEISDGFDSIRVTSGTNDEQEDLSPDLNLTDITEKVDDDEVTESSNNLNAHNDNSVSKSDVNNQSKNNEINVLNNTDTVGIHTAVASNDKSVDHASEDELKQDMLPIGSNQNLLVTSISNNASLLTLQSYSDSESDIEILNLNTNMIDQKVLEDSDIELIDLNTTIIDKQASEVENEISVNESSDPVISCERQEQNQSEAFATNKVEENDDSIDSCSFNDLSNTMSSKPDNVSIEDSHNEQLLVSATASYTESNGGVETEEIDDSVEKESSSETEQPVKTHLDAVTVDTSTNLNEVHNISCIQANLINEMPAPHVSSNDSVCSTSAIDGECNDRKGLLAKIEDSSVSCSNCVELLEPCSEIHESSSNLNLNESNLKNTDLKEDSVELPFKDDVKNTHNDYTNETLVDNEEQPNSGTKSSSVCDHKDKGVEKLEKHEDPKLTDISAESNIKVDEACIKSVTVLHDSNKLVSVAASEETKDSGKYVTDIKCNVEFRDKNEVVLGAEINACGESSVAIETLNDKTSVSVVESFKSEPVESALIESLPFESTDIESRIHNTSNINIFQRNSSEEVTQCVTIIQDKQVSVCKKNSVELEKIAANTIDNVVGELLPTDDCLENGDVCTGTKETQLDTELEKAEDDMKKSSPVSYFDGSKDEKFVCEQVECDNENSDDKDAGISVTEYAELCEVNCTKSLNTDAVVSNCDKNKIISEIDEEVNLGNLEGISGETTDDICSKIPQESNLQTLEEIGTGKYGEICNVSPEERSPKILTEVGTETAEKISCIIPENINNEIKQETICSEDPIELVAENTMLDNSSVIPQPFIQNKQVTTSTSEFSLVTCGSQNEGSVESPVDNSGKKESQNVECAALSGVQFESSLNQTGFENNEASVNEIPKDVCSGTSDDVYKTSHEKLFEESGQCMLGSGSIKSIESGKEPNFELEEGLIEYKPVISGNKLDVNTSDIKEVTQQNKAEDRISVIDVPISTDEDTSVDVVKGGSGTCSVFPVFRRKGMVCVEKRPRTKLKEKSSSKKGSANDGNDQKVHRNIKSKSSGSPTRTLKSTSAIKSVDASKDVTKKSVCSRSQSGGNKLPDNDMDAVCETIPAVTSTNPSSKTKCVTHGCVKQEARVKTRSLSPVESTKYEAGNGKNAMVKQNDKSQVQLIEQTNKNSAKKMTNHANAKRMFTTKPCNKSSSGDKIKINVRKDKTMEKEKQQSDDASVGSIFKRVKFPVVATNITDTITCHQREDETDEEFRRRTENVRQARRKSAAKSYESDFNFENSNAKSSDTSPKLQSSSFWPSDSDTNVDATSFYSNSSGASGSPCGVRDGNTKLNKRLARDFGHEDIASSFKNSTGEKAPIVTRLTVVATSNHKTLQGKSDIGRIHDVKPPCPQVVEKSFLSEKMNNASAALKRGSKSMHSVVQDLASDLKDEVSMGDVHDSLENVVLGKVKAFRALRQERRPFNWEESPHSPKKRKPHSVGEITTEVRNIMGKDRKSNMKSLQRSNKVATTGTRTDQSTTRILREKKGKESTSDKAAIEKKDGLDVKKPDGETRRTKNVNENKSAERPVVRTRSMSGSLERPKSCAGKAVNKNDQDGEKQVKADTPKKVISAKLSSPSVHEESIKRTVKRSRSVRSMESVYDNSKLHLSMESVDDKSKIHLEIGLTTLEDRMTLQSLNDDHIKKECKLDGTSTSPEIRNQSLKKEIESSDDESTRPACRQVIHGGKVFEIQRGRVLETDLQDLTMKTTLQVNSLEQHPTTVPESVVIKRSRRISDQRKRALSPEGIVDSNMCLNSGSTDINKYIRETLKDIKKLRKNNSPWTFQKSAAKKSQRTYPYAFKKS